MALTLQQITEGMSGKRVREILNSNMQATAAEAAAVAAAKVAQVKESVDDIAQKTDKISSANSSNAGNSISVKKDSGEEVVKIDNSGVSVAGSLKKNGEEVLTEHQDISGKADKSYVDDELDKKQDVIEQIIVTSAESTDQGISFWNDAKTTKYVAIGDFGIMATAYLDMDGNPIVTDNSDVITAPIINNTPLDLKKEELRILDLGNSFTTGPTQMLGDMVSAAGIDTSKIAFCRAIRSSGSFKTWYDCYHDADNHNYWADRQFGSLKASIKGTDDSSYTLCNANDGTLFRRLLNDNKWDVIIIHQVSSYSASFDNWTKKGVDGYLTELLRIIRKHQPQASIMFSLVHSVMDNYVENPDGDSKIRWSHIAESARKIRSRYGMSIIPYGTAVENIRLTTLNNEYDLCSDGKHLASGLAKYVGACTYFQTLFAPRYGVSVYGNSLRHTCTDSEKSESTYPTSCVDVTDSNASIAQMAALLACDNHYEVSNPQNINL